MFVHIYNSHKENNKETSQQISSQKFISIVITAHCVCRTSCLLCWTPSFQPQFL